MTLGNGIKLGSSDETLSSLLEVVNKLDGLFTKESYTEGGVTKYRIKANYGLYSDSFISAGGFSSGGGGGGGDIVAAYFNGQRIDADGFIKFGIKVNGTWAQIQSDATYGKYVNIVASGGGSDVSWGAEGTDTQALSVDGVSKTLLTGHQSIALASGTNNGTLKLTVGGVAADNIAVKGLGAMAYKASLAASDIPSLPTSKITSGTFEDERIASASTWNAKYSKPPGGIPKTDLESTVQDSLGLADGALQRSKFDVALRQSGSSLATCDDLIGTCGIFRMGSKSDSVTPDTHGYGQLLSMFGGGDTYAQLYLGYYDNANRNIFFRSGRLTGTGGHKTWHHVYHDGNLTSLSQLAQDETHRLVTDTQTAAWNEVASLFTKEPYTEDGVEKWRIKANFGLYSDGFISAGGIGTGGGGGTDVSWTDHDANYGILTIAGTGHNVSLYGHTHSQYMLASQKGANNGVAELDSAGKIPVSQLPSYVSDVIEYNSQSAFPASGEGSKIYVAKDTNKTYRWTGSAYVEISPSIALGETSATAYRGDRGKTAYVHSQITSGNPHGVSFANIGGSLADSQIPALAISKISGLQTALDGKLSLTGGTMTGSIVYEGDGNIVPLYRNITRTIDGGWSRHIAQLRVDGSSKFSISAFGNYTVGASNNGIVYGYIGCNAYNGLNLRITADSLKWGADDIYHAGNANTTTVAWHASSLTLAGAITGATSGSFSGAVSAKSLTITQDTSGETFLAFTRAGYNYITVPSSRYLAIGYGATGAETIVAFSSSAIAPYSGGNYKDTTTLGTSATPWSAIYGKSLDITGGTVNITGSSASYCQGIRIHPVSGTSSIFFGVSGETGSSPGFFGISHGSAGLRIRGTASADVSTLNDYVTIAYGGNATFSANVVVNGQVTGGAASDLRFKKNIESMSRVNAESILAGLRPVEFDWNDLGTSLSGNKGHDTGLIAQEVCSVFPYAVSPIYERYLRVDYAKLTPILVAGWQSHETRIEKLERENMELKEEIKRLKRT